MRLSIIITILLLLSMSFHFQCSKENNPVEVKDDNTTTFKTMPQQDIPWPGLANSPCPMFLYNPQHTCRSALPGPKEGKLVSSTKIGYDTQWHPAIGPDGTIYVCTATEFLAYNPDGQLKWRNDTGNPFEYTSLIAADGTIYVSTLKQGLWAFTPTGTIKWKFPSDGTKIVNPREPVIAKDGKIIYLAAREWLFALDTNGKLKWKCPTDESFPTAPAMNPDGNMIYVKSVDKALYAIDSTGQLKWTYPTIGQNCSSVMIDNAGNIYLLTGGYCVSVSAAGKLRWQTRIYADDRFNGLSIGWDGTIYAEGSDSLLVAMDYSGTIKWKCVTHFWGTTLSTPVVDINGDIFVGLDGGNDTVLMNFIAINPSGKTKWKGKFLTPVSNIVPDIDSTPIIIPGGKVVVTTSQPWYLFMIQ